MACLKRSPAERAALRFLALHLDRLTQGCERLGIRPVDRGGDSLGDRKSRPTSSGGDHQVDRDARRGPRARLCAGRCGTGDTDRAALSVAPRSRAVPRQACSLGSRRCAWGRMRSSPVSNISIGSSRFWRKPSCALEQMSELLLFSSSGRLVSGTMSNVFIVQDEVLRTPVSSDAASRVS